MNQLIAKFDLAMIWSQQGSFAIFNAETRLMLRQIEVCFNCELESYSISKLLSVAHFKITSGMMNCVGLQASYAPAR